jgi:hypothetical protein
MAAQGRIHTSRKYEDPTPKHIFTDHAWVRNHQDELLEKFGPCYIIVYNEQVLGTGSTEEEAVEEADRNLPAEIEALNVMPEWIGRRHPLLRAYPKEAGTNRHDA